jgi:isopentenyl diphosphate isomerase/L-lactate dehydrogenase-like FMN-dependent dehydrogenase
MLKKPPEEDLLSAATLFTTIYSNPAITWEKLKFLREHTTKPILLKGINHPDDARQALDHGIDGILVSNHGGRQVDGARAALDSLDEIAQAIGGRMPILFDSGIRGGAGIFKALALGAAAVCVGRPYVYGLALAGEAGVRAVLRNMVADFDLTMATAGCASIAEVNRDMLVRV